MVCVKGAERQALNVSFKLLVRAGANKDKAVYNFS